MLQLLVELSALLAIWLLINTLQRDAASPGRWAFIAMCAAVVFWTLVIFADLDGAISDDLARRASLLPAHVLPPLWLVLSMSVRDAATLRGRLPLVSLLFVPCSLVVTIPPDAGSQGWQLVRWALTVYGGSLAVLGSVQFIYSAERLHARGDRARRVTISLVTLMPLIASVGFFGLGLRGVDPTPILVATALVAIRSELFSGDLIRSLPLSQHDVVGRLPVPIILTDLFGRVMEANPAALRRLGTERLEALDRNVDAILSEAEQAQNFESWALVESGRSVGRIYVPSEAVDPARQAR